MTVGPRRLGSRFFRETLESLELGKTNGKSNVGNRIPSFLSLYSLKLLTPSPCLLLTPPSRELWSPHPLAVYGVR